VRSGAPWLKLSYLVHLGNACAVVALCTNDMLQLRCCMVGASLWGIAYNVLQPTPLLAPAGWGCFFICGHIFQIGRILRERAHVEMTEDAVDLYEAAFHPHHFLPRQFLRIMELGRVELLEAGAVITSIGHEATELILIWHGAADVRDRSNVRVGHIGQHRWIGNMVPRSAGNNQWNYNIKAESQCKVIKWRRVELDELLDSDRTLHVCAASLIATDLTQKLSDSAAAHALHEYHSMLEVAVADGRLVAEEKKQLREFRQRHSLSMDDHSRCLAVLGWSDHEYDDGVKHNKTDSKDQARLFGGKRDFLGGSAVYTDH